MNYYLDTNIIIYSLKGIYPAIREHFSRIPPQCIVVPSVVAAEIEFGAQKSRSYEKTISLYRQFMNYFSIMDFTDRAAVCYGRIRRELELKGTPIGANDLLIASSVLSENGILVTHNTTEFSRISGLRVEDWTLE